MSSALQTFDDRTIKRARERFTRGKRGSGDDPIATHSKVAQDVLLGHLENLISRAENKAYDTNAGLQGELDGEALIDPFLSYDENVANIQDEYGVEFETYAREKQKDRDKTADEKSRRHARDWITEKVRETAGSADPADVFRSAIKGETNNDELELAIAEIREEFDETLLSDVLTGLEVPADDITAPEPSPVESPTDEAVESTETIRFETIAEPILLDRPTQTAEPEPAETPEAPVETAETRDYSGPVGILRLVKDVIVANYEAGKSDTIASDATQQTLEAY